MMHSSAQPTAALQKPPHGYGLYLVPQGKTSGQWERLLSDRKNLRTFFNLQRNVYLCKGVNFADEAHL